MPTDLTYSDKLPPPARGPYLSAGSGVHGALEDVLAAPAEHPRALIPPGAPRVCPEKPGGQEARRPSSHTPGLHASRRRPSP